MRSITLAMLFIAISSAAPMPKYFLEGYKYDGVVAETPPLPAVTQDKPLPVHKGCNSGETEVECKKRLTDVIHAVSDLMSSKATEMRASFKKSISGNTDPVSFETKEASGVARRIMGAGPAAAAPMPKYFLEGYKYDGVVAETPPLPAVTQDKPLPVHKGCNSGETEVECKKRLTDVIHAVSDLISSKATEMRASFKKSTSGNTDPVSFETKEASGVVNDGDEAQHKTGQTKESFHDQLKHMTTGERMWARFARL